jgi:hypothetical protein
MKSTDMYLGTFLLANVDGFSRRHPSYYGEPYCQLCFERCVYCVTCAIYNYRKRRSAPVNLGRLSFLAWSPLLTARDSVLPHVTRLHMLIVYYRFISM